MLLDSFKNALASVFSNKIRSLLTVLGVVIGVSSVTILVSLGQGLKNDVSALVSDFGTNVLFVLPGQIDPSGNNTQMNPANFLSGDILTLEDVETIRGIEGIQTVAPMALVAGQLKQGDKTAMPTMLGTTPEAIEAIELFSLEAGRTFEAGTTDNVILLTADIKTELFGTAEAIGQEVRLGQETFEVIGLLGKESKKESLLGGEFDRVAIVPFDVATRLNNDQVRIMRLIVRVDETENVEPAIASIRTELIDNHRGEENFTVLTQEDMLDLFNQFLDLTTVLVSAIAAISLIVGGIGIMNIMLVTVTERTREIGLRKAVGATKGAILIQFLIEAITITLVGGLIGLAISLIVGWVIAAQSPLTPEITPGLVAVALGLSTVIGIIFGLWPAMRAADKDPIEALRYE